MSDDEMRAMNFTQVQTDGLLFLWVTGRAMELGRECMQTWGCVAVRLPWSVINPEGARYERVGEIVWVKTNQLQKLVRSGRTGHWLNHRYAAG